MKSKRCALRFPCSEHRVSYKTAYDEGEGHLINISTAGCAFAESTLGLSIDEKVLVSINLPGTDTVFQAQGIVVRVNEQGETALHFTRIEPEDQSLLRSHFAKKMRKR